MKIVVLVKQILDPEGITVRRDKERIFINREDYIVDPASRAAIEAALRLKDSGEATVTALTVGPPRADDALREALAMGCDAAYLVSDPLFDDVDAAGAVHILAAAIGKLDGADLVVAGLAAADTSAGQVGPRLAEALGYAQVTDVYELAAGDTSVQCARRWAAGYAGVEAPLPAVVTVAPEGFAPRLAPGDRIISAYRDWEVVTWNAAHLELEEADLAPRLSFRSETFPPPLETGEVLRGDPADIAEELLFALRRQRLID